MKNWFSKNLGDGILSSEPLDLLEKTFLSAYTRAGSPPEFAVFIRHESEGRLHCEVKVYFSPASAVLARKLGAVRCSRPSPHGLSLFGGPEESWQLLFPESVA